MEDRHILDGYLLPDHIDERWSVDQICSNVASSQLDPLAATTNLHQISRTTRSIIPPAFTSPISSLSAATTPDDTAEGALNLSISNRSSPSSSSTSLLEPLSSQRHVHQQPQQYHSQTSHQPPQHSPGTHPPTTRASSLPCPLTQHTRAASVGADHLESWPPDSFPGAYRDQHDIRSRRDSTDSTDHATTSSYPSYKTDDASTDEAGKERRRRQKLANKDNLFCQVCGDKANGYNFGAITCESCKAFFRRNAQKNKDLKCNFENSCKIDHFTRKFCTACRLSKCFSVNMKKEWILDEDQLKKRKKLTRRVVRDDTPTGEYDPIHAFQPLTTSQMYGASNLPQVAHPSGLFMYMDPLLAVSGDHGSSDDKDYPPVALSDEHRAEIDRIMENHGLIDSASSPPSSVNTPTGGPPSNLPQEPLLQIKTEPTAEPVVVVEPAAPDEEPAKKSEDDGPDFLQNQPEQILNMAGGFISRLIKFVRHLPEFSELSQHDQVALLKGGIMETLVIRSAIVHDSSVENPDANTETTSNSASKDSSSPRKDPISNTASPPSPPAPAGPTSQVTKDMVSEHIKFIKSFNDVAKWDKPTMVLAMIVNLFSSDRTDLIKRDGVARAAERYATLLQTYLKSIYGVKEACSLYPQLLLTLSKVRSYGEISAQHMVRVTLSDLEPLMREMFSIK